MTQTKYCLIKILNIFKGNTKLSEFINLVGCNKTWKYISMEDIVYQFKNNCIVQSHLRNLEKTANEWKIERGAKWGVVYNFWFKKKMYAIQLTNQKIGLNLPKLILIENLPLNKSSIAYARV